MMDKYKIYREIGRLIYFGKRRHNVNLWPFVQIKRDSNGLICGLSAFNKELPIIPIYELIDNIPKDIHLVLSGPSVKDIDYSKLSNCIYFGVNGSISLNNNYNLKFKYYCIIDKTFVTNKIELVKKIVLNTDYLFVTPDVARYILQFLDTNRFNCKFIVIENILEKAYMASLSVKSINDHINNGKKDLVIFSNEPLLGFSNEPTLGWFDADTVAYTCIQLLFWFKVRNVYFHGLDMKFNHKIKRFYEIDSSNSAGSRIEQNFEKIILPSIIGAVKRTQGKINFYNLSKTTAVPYSLIPYLDWKSLQ